MIEAGDYLIPIKEIEYVELYDSYEFYIYLKNGNILTINIDNEKNTFKSILIQYNELKGSD